MRKKIKKLLGLNTRKERKPYNFVRQNSSQGSPAEQRRTKILNLLDFTKTSGTSYSGDSFPAGYHEISLDGQVFKGQRNPQERLDLSGLDFSGKTILDIGCNQGGMLFALSDQAKWVVGVDYDYRMVNCCNAISQKLGVTNSSFYVFDIDTDPHDLLEDFLPDQKVDIIFLLSVCMWVDRWQALIDKCCELSKVMLFESNGSQQQQDEQFQYINEKFSEVKLVSGSSQDDPGQKRRKLFVCQNI